MRIQCGLCAYKETFELITALGKGLNHYVPFSVERSQQRFNEIVHGCLLMVAEADGTVDEKEKEYIRAVCHTDMKFESVGERKQDMAKEIKAFVTPYAMLDGMTESDSFQYLDDAMVDIMKALAELNSDVAEVEEAVAIVEVMSWFEDAWKKAKAKGMKEKRVIEGLKMTSFVEQRLDLMRAVLENDPQTPQLAFEKVLEYSILINNIFLTHAWSGLVCKPQKLRDLFRFLGEPENKAGYLAERIRVEWLMYMSGPKKY